MRQDDATKHPVPPAELVEHVHAANERARASGALVPLDTEVRLVPDGGVTFLVRVSTNVARKQAAAADTGAPADDHDHARGVTALRGD
jgi:ATP adenylyltransferase/5',5'''-P-1,P-4-tetraphosphate phosphorylase II